MYNYLDASIHVQLNFVNRKTDQEQIARSFEIPPCGDDLDPIREENSGILKRQLAALYGHTTIGVGSPSISLSPTGGISISFSGNTSIDPVGGHKAKIAIGSSSSSPVVTTIS